MKHSVEADYNFSIVNVWRSIVFRNYNWMMDLHTNLVATLDIYHKISKGFRSRSDLLTFLNSFHAQARISFPILLGLVRWFPNGLPICSLECLLKSPSSILPSRRFLGMAVLVVEFHQNQARNDEHDSDQEQLK